VYRSVRAHELCDGGEDGARGCPDANDVTCGKCGLIREVEDTAAPGDCPQCGSWQFTVNRCDRCLVNELDYVRAHSGAGRLFERVLELEFDCLHFAVPWNDVTAEEVKGLQVLKEERDRYQRDLQKDTERVTPEEARQLRLMQKYGKG
jgi:predicted RNA-binding Zn-ribbon protein involved in translation (DUF1610 family)